MISLNLFTRTIVAHPKNALAMSPPMKPATAMIRASELKDSRVSDRSDLIAAIRHPKERKIEPRSPSPNKNISKRL